MESSAAMKKAITNSSFCRALIGAILMVGIVPNALAANRLMDVKYHSMVDHQLELELVFESAVTSPTVDLSAEPAEIMLNCGRRYTLAPTQFNCKLPFTVNDWS